MYIILILFFEWRQILIENDLKNFWGVEVIKSTMTFVEQSNSFYWKGIVRSEIKTLKGRCLITKFLQKEQLEEPSKLKWNIFTLIRW